MSTKERAIDEKIYSLEFVVNAISEEWKIPIVWQMNEGKQRPIEFIKGIGKVDR